MTPDEARLRAEKEFKLEERARDGRLAVAQYEAEARAIREKTARLRALRLARDAMAQGANPAPKTLTGSAQPQKRKSPKRGSGDLKAAASA